MASQSRSGHSVRSVPIGPVAKNTAAGSSSSRSTGIAWVARLRVPSSKVIARARGGSVPPASRSRASSRASTLKCART